MKKAVKITLEKLLSPKAIIIRFITVFGIIWLILEPLAFFDILTEYFKKMNYWGYLLLCFLSACITGILVLLERNFFYSKRLEVIKLEIIIETDGSTHLVEAPQNMKTAIFLDLFLDYLEKIRLDEIRNMRNYYKPSLYIFKNNEKVGLLADLNKTIKENNISNGDRCKVTGKVYRSTMNFSKDNH